MKMLCPQDDLDKWGRASIAKAIVGHNGQMRRVTPKQDAEWQPTPCTENMLYETLLLYPFSPSFGPWEMTVPEPRHHAAQNFSEHPPTQRSSSQVPGPEGRARGRRPWAREESSDPPASTPRTPPSWAFLHAMRWDLRISGAKDGD